MHAVAPGLPARARRGRACRLTHRARAAAVSQTLTHDLRHWLATQLHAGCRPEDLLRAMRASGWDEAVARAALQQALPPRSDGPPAPDPHAPAASAVPEPDLHGAPDALRADGHRLQLLLTLRLPRVVLFGGFLSADECAQLIALAAPRLRRSQTVHDATGGSEFNPARTSEGMFFERGEHELVARIEARIAALLRWPSSHGEGLQVLRYRTGAEYRPHHDWFDPAHAGTARILQRGGQRVATLVMYLNTPSGGGATTFPEVGLDVAPVRGQALFFSYDRPHADTRTLHGGAPVTAGEKWVATKWLREGPFV